MRRLNFVSVVLFASIGSLGSAFAAEPAAPSGPAAAAEPDRRERLPASPQLRTATADDSLAESTLRLDDLPLESRSDVDAAIQWLPGAQMSEDGLRLLGGSPQTRATFVDGFRVHSLRPPLAFVDRIAVRAAGYGLELGDAPAGAVLITTLSHANQWRATVEVSQESRDRQQFLTFYPNRNAYLVDGSDDERQRRSLQAALVAPLWSDRLTLAASFAHDWVSSPPLRDPEGILPSTSEVGVRELSAAVTATFRPSTRHRVAALLLYRGEAGEEGFELGRAPETQPERKESWRLLGLRWTGQLTTRIASDLRIGWQSDSREVAPALCRTSPETCSFVVPTRVREPRILVGNGDHRLKMTTDHLQAGGGLSYRLGDPTRWHQRLRLFVDFETESRERKDELPSGQLFELASSYQLAARLRAYDRDPREPGALAGVATSQRDRRQLLIGFEDEVSWRRRLHLRLGVGMIYVGFESHRPTTQSAVEGSAPVLDLAARFDVMGNGRLWVRASAARRADGSADGTALSTSDALVYERCQWDVISQAFGACGVATPARAETQGLPCGPSGYHEDGAPCRAAAFLPRIHEQTLGASHRVRPGVWAHVDVVHRRVQGLPVAVETNRIWNRPGVLATPSNNFRNGKSYEILDVSGHQEMARRYLGATVSTSFDLHGFSGILAYTVSSQRASRAFGRGLWPPPIELGADDDDQRHGVRLLSSYDFRRVASIGVLYAFHTGRPIIAPPAPVGTPTGGSPGRDVNDPADDPRDVRVDGIHRLNLQARVRLGRFLPVGGVDFFAEVFNLFDQDELLGANLDGRWTRIGLVLRH